MKRTHNILLSGLGVLLVNVAVAQTGQVPKAYTGQQGRPATINQPKPTGQIAPQVPGQPLGSLPQEQPATQTQQVSREVQSLGFEPQTNSQQGQVPKVNTNQDQRTMPERYQPGQPTRARQMVIETETTNQDNVNVSVQPAGSTTTTTTSSAGVQSNVNVSRPVQNANKSAQPAPVQQSAPVTNQQPAIDKP